MQNDEINNVKPVLPHATVSGCCKAGMIPPDWDAVEEAGSLWPAYASYICKSCGKQCEPIDFTSSPSEQLPPLVDVGFCSKCGFYPNDCKCRKFIELKAQQFADLKHNRSCYAWSVAYESYLAALITEQNFCKPDVVRCKADVERELKEVTEELRWRLGNEPDHADVLKLKEDLELELKKMEDTPAL
jgi:hypothetical protein